MNRFLRYAKPVAVSLLLVGVFVIVCAALAGCVNYGSGPDQVNPFARIMQP